jgi:hypothetical protein
MTLEIGCGSTILRVQVAANTLLTLLLAFPGSKLEEMVLAVLIISDRNLSLEKNRRWLNLSWPGDTLQSNEVRFVMLEVDVDNLDKAAEVITN